MELGESVNGQREMFMTITKVAVGKTVVGRVGANDAGISFAAGAYVGMSMEALRDLYNDIAAVLDEWFDERDRMGNRG